MRIALLVSLILSFVSSPAYGGQQDQVATGTIVEHVVAADEPGQSYALYLPAAYTRDRAWPIVYCFDPDARGVQPVERFKTAAELYGWIVVGSNNSRNGPMQDSIAAGAAMWRDTHARFRIDDRRVYSAGFSGGARVATISAIGCGDCIAGVIACGAGFPPQMSPTEAAPKDPIKFAYFMTVGVDDFNYPELTALEPALTKLGVPNHLERFDGTHDWAPPDVCVLALGFMETQAMRAGTLARDSTVLDAIYDRALAAAKAQQTSGHVLEAFVAYSGIINQFKGLRDTSAADAALASLRDAKEVKSGLKAETDQVQKQRTIVNETVGYANLRSDNEQRAVATQEFRRRISDLKTKAKAESDSPDRRVARRALHQIFAYFYEGGMNLYYGGKYAMAAVSLETATEIAPKASGIYVDLARARMKAGDRKRALDAIEQAVDAGYDGAKSLSGDVAFESLRGDPRFQQAVQRAASAKPVTP